MPNRIIKESICTSEQIDELSLFDEVFFYRLLVNCDDYGCMDAREKVLTAKLFPLRAVRPSDIVKSLNRLAEIGLIGLYEVEDHPYLKVLKWADHQRVRISKHKYPEPTEEMLSDFCGKLRRVAASCGESRQTAASCGKLRPESNPIQSESNPNTNTNPNTNPIRSREKKPTDDPAFILFWEAYPKKVSKPDAVKAWEKLKPDVDLVGSIMKGLSRWKDSAEWQQNDGQFIPYPASWLNKRRWEDDVRPASQAPASVPVKRVAAQDYPQRDYSNEQEEALQRMLASAGWGTGG